MKFSVADKDKFLNLVDSLKKCRRADLSDVSSKKDIIEDLYVDPLDNDLVLKSVLKNNTTILSGRRGTGKSTIIARLQHEVRKSKDKLSLYIDVKTIFEQSKIFNYDSSHYVSHFSEIDLRKYLIYKSFLKEIISQTKDEIKTNTLKFFLAKITSIFGPDKTKFENELSLIFDEINKFEYLDVEVLKLKKISASSEVGASASSDNGLSLEIAADATPGVAVNHKTQKSSNQRDSFEEASSEALLKSFNPILIMRSIRELLQKIGIKHVFICLDDFSEIDLDAMKVFVDVIISPLNNLSEEYFKFKIAAYPGRIYLGDIDPQKIEQIKLDYYDLYIAKKVSETQNQAQEGIQKLLEKRTEYFCKKNPDYFFDTSKNDISDFYKLIFDITASVPRNVGWILWYANQQSISKDKKITMNDLYVAAERHYMDTVSPYFSQNQFMREPFDMKLNKYHLSTLLQSFISSSKINKSYISTSDSKIFERDKSRPPTSHFYINKKYEDYLKPLELQFFITKFNEQKDQDSSELMSFFSLNFGLCESEDIIYGKGSDRKYVIQRRFNYTRLVHEYISSAKNITCNTCDAQHELDMLPMLEAFDMLCPKCKKGICSINEVAVAIPMANEEIQLPELDMQLLNSLNIESPQYASSLAQELDCTYQKISRRALKLKESDLLSIEKKKIDEQIGERSYYSLTKKAINIYFSSEHAN